MKIRTQLLALVLATVCLVQAADETINAEQMTQWIRARGTFAVSLVDLDQTVNQKAKAKSDALKDAVSPDALGVNLGSAVLDAIPQTGDEYNLFTNSKVELPLVCNPGAFPKEDFVKWERLASIATGGSSLMNCWNKAAGSKGPIDYLNMPALKAGGLAQFYKCAAETYGSKMSEAYIQVPDALVDPPALLTVATFGDFTRTDISWLEVWVFMCCKAKQPEDSMYMAKDPEAMKAMMETQSSRILQQQKNIASSEIKQATQNVQDMAKNVSMGLGVNNGTRFNKHKTMFTYSNMLKMEHLNNRFEAQSKRNHKVEKMIESNAAVYNKKHTQKNKKRLSKMKLNSGAPELAQGIQQMFIRAQDPELIQQLKQYQNTRLRKNKMEKKVTKKINKKLANKKVLKKTKTVRK